MNDTKQLREIKNIVVGSDQPHNQTANQSTSQTHNQTTSQAHNQSTSQTTSQTSQTTSQTTSQKSQSTQFGLQALPIQSDRQRSVEHIGYSPIKPIIQLVPFMVPIVKPLNELDISVVRKYVVNHDHINEFIYLHRMPNNTTDLTIRLLIAEIDYNRNKACHKNLAEFQKQEIRAIYFKMRSEILKYRQQIFQLLHNEINLQQQARQKLDETVEKIKSDGCAITTEE